MTVPALVGWPAGSGHAALPTFTFTVEELLDGWGPVRLAVDRMVESFRQLYNTIRPHETLAGARPIEAYLADPDTASPEPLSATSSTRQSMRIP